VYFSLTLVYSKLALHNAKYELQPCDNPRYFINLNGSYYSVPQILKGLNYGSYRLPAGLWTLFTPEPSEVWIDKALLIKLEKEMFERSHDSDIPQWAVDVQHQVLWGALYRLCQYWSDETGEVRPVSHRVADLIAFVSFLRNPDYYQKEATEKPMEKFVAERNEWWKHLAPSKQLGIAVPPTTLSDIYHMHFHPVSSQRFDLSSSNPSHDLERTESEPEREGRHRMRDRREQNFMAALRMKAERDIGVFSGSLKSRFAHRTGLSSAELEHQELDGPLSEIRASTIKSGPYDIRTISNYARHLTFEESEDHSNTMLVLDSDAVRNAYRPQCLGIATYEDPTK
jgi:hypothetical protein